MPNIDEFETVDKMSEQPVSVEKGDVLAKKIGQQTENDAMNILNKIKG